MRQLRVRMLLAAAPDRPATGSATAPASATAMEGTRQVTTVSRTHCWHARVTFWALQERRWRRRFAASGGRRARHYKRFGHLSAARAPIAAIGR